MRAGKIEQIDTPEALYDRPATRFVANFLGEANFLDNCPLTAEPDIRQPVGTFSMIRPERIMVRAPSYSRQFGIDLQQSVAGRVVENMIYAGC